MKIFNRIYTIDQNWNRVFSHPDGGYRGTISTSLGIVLVEQHTYKQEKEIWSTLILIAMKGNQQYIRQFYNMKTSYTKRGLSIIANKFIKGIFK